MKWEGGFFNYPSDPGGVTNFGVSLMFLKILGLQEGDINGDVDSLDVGRKKSPFLVLGAFFVG